MIEIASINDDFQNKLKNIDKNVLEVLHIDDFTIDNMINILNFQDIERISYNISLDSKKIIDEYESYMNKTKIDYDIRVNIDELQLKHVNDNKKITEIHMYEYDDNIETIYNYINKYNSINSNHISMCYKYLLIPFHILSYIVILTISNKNIECKEYFKHINESINDFYQQYDINKDEFKKIINIINEIYIKFDKKEYILKYNRLLYICIYKTFNHITDIDFDLQYYDFYKDTLIINKIYDIIYNEEHIDKKSDLYKQYILSEYNKDIINKLNDNEIKKDSFEYILMNNIEIGSFCNKHKFNKYLLIQCILNIIYLYDDFYNNFYSKVIKKLTKKYSSSNSKETVFHNDSKDIIKKYIDDISEKIKNKIIEYGLNIDIYVILYTILSDLHSIISEYETNPNKNNIEILKNKLNQYYEKTIKDINDNYDYFDNFSNNHSNDLDDSPLKEYYAQEYTDIMNSIDNIIIHSIKCNDIIDYCKDKPYVCFILTIAIIDIKYDDYVIKDDCNDINDSIKSLELSLKDKQKIYNDINEFKNMFEEYIQLRKNINIRSYRAPKLKIYNTINNIKSNILKYIEIYVKDNYDKLVNDDEFNKKFIRVNIKNIDMNYNENYNMNIDIETLIESIEDYKKHSFDEKIYTKMQNEIDNIYESSVNNHKYIYNHSKDVDIINYLKDYFSTFNINKIVIEYLIYYTLCNSTNKNDNIELLACLLIKYRICTLQYFNSDGICLLLSIRYLKNILERNAFVKYFNDKSQTVNESELMNLYNNNIRIDTNEKLIERYYNLVKEILSNDNECLLKIDNDCLLNINNNLLLEDYDYNHFKYLNEILYNIHSFSFLFSFDECSHSKNSEGQSSEGQSSEGQSFKENLDDLFCILSYIYNNNLILTNTKYELKDDKYEQSTNIIVQYVYNYLIYCKIDDSLINNLNKSLYNHSLTTTQCEYKNITFNYNDIRYYIKYLYMIYEITIFIHILKNHEKSMFIHYDERNIYDIFVNLYKYYLKTNPTTCLKSIYYILNNSDILSDVLKEESKEVYNQLKIFNIEALIKFYNNYKQTIQYTIQDINNFKNCTYIHYKNYIEYNDDNHKIIIKDELYEDLKKIKIFDIFNEINDYVKSYDINELKCKLISIFASNCIFETKLKKYLKNNDYMMFPSLIDTNIDSKDINHCMLISYKYSYKSLHPRISKKESHESYKNVKLEKLIYDPNLYNFDIDLDEFLNIITYDYLTELEPEEYVERFKKSLRYMNGGSNKPNILKIIIILICVVILVIVIICCCIKCCSNESFRTVFNK